MADDPFAVLGVAPNAPPEEIAEAYRALAQIYHPDRYSEAPARVQAEANTRMQALNAAFAAVRNGRSQPRTAPAPADAPPAPRCSTPAPAAVQYVDGSKTFHSGDVAPLGFEVSDGGVQPGSDQQRCGRLDRELLAWFDSQRRNASVPARQLYESWDTQEQAAYAAKLGASRVSRQKASAFAVSCPECRP